MIKIDAFIPLRGGSKSIKNKNIKPIAGKPLCCWTIEAALNCDFVESVYISTDSEEIKSVIKQFDYQNLEFVNRSPESASDTASSEIALLEFAHKSNADSIVFIQATSPLLSSEELKNGIIIHQTKNNESVLSVVPQKRFIWTKSDDKSSFIPSNYDPFNRPRRQDFEGYWVENGAFYISTRKSIIKSSNRFVPPFHIAEMSEESYYEIDEPSDWVIIEQLLQNRAR